MQFRTKGAKRRAIGGRRAVFSVQSVDETPVQPSTFARYREQEAPKQRNDPATDRGRGGAEMFDNVNALELALSALALLAGFTALALVPELAPLAVVVALIGAAGLVFGHW